MVSLIPLPNRETGDTPQNEIWVNPAHITSLRPFLTGAAPQVTLTIEIKLEGLPLQRAHFGTFATLELASARWDKLLNDLRGAGDR